MNVTKESLDSEIRKYLELRLDYLKTIDGLSIVVSRVFALMENFPDGSRKYYISGTPFANPKPRLV